MIKLDKFLSKKYTEKFESYKDFHDGYEGSYLDLLNVKARRRKSIFESKLFDRIQPENDPNYSRGNVFNLGKMNSAISGLFIVTQSISIISTNRLFSKYKEYIPSNVFSLLTDLDALSSTGINLLENLKQRNTLKLIEDAFLSDLVNQYSLGDLNFSDVSAIFKDFSKENVQRQLVENTGLNSIFSMPINSIFEGKLSDFLELEDYYRLVRDLYKGYDQAQDQFDRIFSNKVKQLNKQLPSDYMVAQTNYLSLNDPVGLIARERFAENFKTIYNNELNTYIEETVQLVPYPHGPLDHIKLYCTEYSSENIDDVMDKGTIGLPAVSSIIRGIEVESFNQTETAIKNSLEIFSKDIIQKNTDMFIPTKPSDVFYTDHLMNLKKNLQARIDMQKRSCSSEEFKKIESYLEQYFRKDRLISSELENTNKELDKILKING